MYYKYQIFFPLTLKNESLAQKRQIRRLTFSTHSCNVIHLKDPKKGAVAYSFLTHGKKESTPKKLGRIINKKQKYDKSHLSLAFTDIHNLLYFILSHKTFSSYIVPVKL